jgi:uncharacterized protein with ParB-like and HNH nuclease domain
VQLSLTAQDRFKAESLSILELFQNSTYEIPRFQRDYAWTREQCESLWTDWKNLIDTNSTAHFLGPMVVVRIENQGKKFLVIDGQQRITTLQMIISLIRDRWVELNPGKKQTDMGPKPYEDICKSLIENGAPLYKKVFTPNFYIAETFMNYVQRELDDVERKKFTDLKKLTEQERDHAEELFSAYRYFRDEIEGLNFDQLLNYEQRLLNDFLVLRIDAVEIDNAFVLFDTLNNRGLDLTQGDLVKNYLFQQMGEVVASQVSNEVAKILQDWDSIAEKVSLVKLDNFLRYFLIIKLNSKIQKETIFKKIQSQYQGKQAVKQLIKELSDFSDLFALIEGNDKFSGIYKDELNAMFEDLGDLDQSTQAVFLLAALKRFNNYEKKEHYTQLSIAVRAAEILSFRFLICGRNAQDIENIWREGAILLLSSSKSDQEALDQALEFLKGSLPSNEELKSELSNKVIRSSKFARYILRKIENARKAGNVWVLAGSSKLDVEHIAPKSPDGEHDWRSVMAGDLNYRSIIYLIGNQTLLSRGPNRKAKNAEFEKKKKIYLEEKEDLPKITQDILKNKKWNQAAVVKRSKDLAIESLNVWDWDSLNKSVKAIAVTKKKRSRKIKSAVAKSKKTKRKSRKRTKAK